MDANPDFFQKFLASLKPEISKKLTDEGYDNFPTLKGLIADKQEFMEVFPRSADRMSINLALKELESVAAGTIPTRFPKKLYFGPFPISWPTSCSKAQFPLCRFISMSLVCSRHPDSSYKVPNPFQEWMYGVGLFASEIPEASCTLRSASFQRFPVILTFYSYSLALIFGPDLDFFAPPF